MKLAKTEDRAMSMPFIYLSLLAQEAFTHR